LDSALLRWVFSGKPSSRSQQLYVLGSHEASIGDGDTSFRFRPQQAGVRFLCFQDAMEHARTSSSVPVFSGAEKEHAKLFSCESEIQILYLGMEIHALCSDKNAGSGGRAAFPIGRGLEPFVRGEIGKGRNVTCAFSSFVIEFRILRTRGRRFALFGNCANSPGGTKLTYFVSMTIPRTRNKRISWVSIAGSITRRGCHGFGAERRRFLLCCSDGHSVRRFFIRVGWQSESNLP